ncbi:hypothetical protein [Streptomyces sp. NPDC051677]|uniref:hypothetical protein n=1 Tax=Streptomyces sp. NPDC051677 TaxID=3365669 RepID=UPI0037D619A8
MSADQETNHDMTQHDIAGLLADAADEVEIGIAPTQAVIRGGRRRRARRSAVVAAMALVVAGSTGALAAGGLPGGGGERVTPAATGTPGAVQSPSRTILGTGTDQGKPWKVAIDVWPAPRDVAGAQAELKAMAKYRETLPTVRKPSDLVGRIAFFLRSSTGDENGPGTLIHGGLIDWSDVPPDPTKQYGTVPAAPGPGSPDRVVLGPLTETTKRVTCNWKDGTRTELVNAPANEEPSTDKSAIRSVEGTSYDWFVCLVPQGTTPNGVDFAQ